MVKIAINPPKYTIFKEIYDRDAVKIAIELSKYFI
jgi:hypothetical protein